MKKLAWILMAILVSTAVATGCAPVQTTVPQTGSNPIKSATAIAEVYGDGQKVSAVAVEYNQPIDTAKLKLTDYTVQGKTVTKVYANTSASKAASGVNGTYVIVELNTDIVPDAGFGGSPSGSGASDASPKTTAQPAQNGSPNQGGGPQLGDKATDSAVRAPLTASITQCGDVVASDGTVILSSTAAHPTEKTINLVVQDFKQGVYSDLDYKNRSLMYNLYVPQNYDPSKKYPLVLFIHDAGVVINNPTATLTQGLGAVVWASKESQAKNPCFVLAPQYNRVIAGDASTTTEDMNITVDLIKSLETQYSIDSNRLYNTGQSMGGMTSIAMDIQYPDLFAASFLVACQWDAAKVAPMAKEHLWIIVSEGDSKAHPGMDAITAALQKNGATVSKAAWVAESSGTTFDAAVADQLKNGSTVNYTLFKNGNHRYTWQYAYTIQGVRDWLFKQVKNGSNRGTL